MARAEPGRRLELSFGRGREPPNAAFSAIPQQPSFRDDLLFSAKSNGELVCLETKTGKQIWETDKVTALERGASIHLTAVGPSFLLYNDRGDLIRAQLTREGYKEISRAHLLEPTSPLFAGKFAWSPPAYANGRAFLRNDTELICVPLIAEQ